mmetsp:Transcript_32183/g.51202  ORF Transcript_32183/g.51202 Transcript_32183/m.51202 type:complete len:774 (-) Transcript_32183:1003-3324(-)|eukprot:CAMPEP_0203753626 /NCGR_PEP_ID=MMETSP0098-20131031/7360_1 /ASSEMBLY_ACC=CAM_ASM_000208 /TAXON_ID=96639 /ORGANISM=" , Strain NY0313808BC1" /LENGTH=773 /DNA_ID=CAMNT_0050644295 /DNA_START=17 /DNA_END=2338 /DNA_ORIENTATION=+
MATPNRAPTKGVPTYFVDQRKGEVNELKALLQNQSVQRDPRRKREVVKKVIAYMTLGFDVSRLFSEIVMASSTPDIILKKMCYLYLSKYAESNEELATLCINTMTKDCQDSDPLVRGLALRSLSSLRLTSTLEYLLPMLNQGLSDNSPYVRRNAVMAVLKLYDLDKSIIKESDMVDGLFAKLRDRDGQVCASALVVLSEIMLDEGGIPLDLELVTMLLNRIREFNEWGQCTVLALVAKYRPASQDETFAIMNILDACLRVANSAVVLATMKCFLRYADSMRHIKEQVYLRLKQPMMTLMASPCHELRFSVLKHVDIMVRRCPGIFDDQFKQFYIHYNEPSHLKFVKLHILPELTNEENVHELVNELSEYVNDINPEISKRAILSFGRIAVKIPAGADGIINQLLEFIHMDVDYVRAQVVIVIKDLLRKYPDRAGDVLPALPRCLRRVEDPEGKAAVIFMLGEFGAGMRQAPYLLEPVVDGYEEEPSVIVKSTLLTAVMKLFFVRAPEVHGILTQLLTMMVNDTSDTDVHDRALLYYRLLKLDVNEARRCVAMNKSAITTFAEEQLGGLKQRLFEEFNTLSVLYGKPADQFIDDQFMDSPYISIGPLGDAPPAYKKPSEPYTEPMVEQQQEQQQSEDLGDLLGFDLSSGSPAQAPSRQPWALKSNVTITQDEFQSQWEHLEASSSLDLPLSSCPTAEQVEKLAMENQIHCMASGDLGPQLKFYFFGRDNQGTLHLAEVQLEKQGCRLTATIKSEDPLDSQTFADSFMASMGSLL